MQGWAILQNNQHIEQLPVRYTPPSREDFSGFVNTVLWFINTIKVGPLKTPSSYSTRTLTELLRWLRSTSRRNSRRTPYDKTGHGNLSSN